jgi:hypothetical protein
MYSEYFETGSKKGRGWREHLQVCALDAGIQTVESAESRLEFIQSLGLKDLTVAPEHTNLKAGEAAPDSNADGLDLPDYLKRAAP